MFCCSIQSPQLGVRRLCSLRFNAKSSCFIMLSLCKALCLCIVRLKFMFLEREKYIERGYMHLNSLVYERNETKTVWLYKMFVFVYSYFGQGHLLKQKCKYFEEIHFLHFFLLQFQFILFFRLNIYVISLLLLLYKTFLIKCISWMKTIVSNNNSCETIS